MKKQYLISIIILGVITSCSPSMKITSSWMNQEITGKEKYQKIFLIAMANNLSSRQTVENAQAEAASAEGIVTVKSSEVFPPNFLKDKPGKDAVVAKIRETGCDAIFTSALVDSKSETHYVPGTNTFYAPYPRYGYYGTFGGYYGYGAGFMYDPGYYVNDKTYFIESNLYDAQTEELIWSVQSEVYNPGNLTSASKEYAALLINRLKADGGLNRKK